jgi:hypothetical protein
MSESSILFHWFFCLLFYVSTVLFLLLWLCSIIWIQVLWYFQHCCFCLGLFWLFGIFSIWKFHINFRINSSISVKMDTGVLMVIALILVVCFSHFCQSMNMRGLFIFQCLQFLFSVFCSFHCRSLSSLLVGLFLSIYFLRLLWMGLFSWFFLILFIISI